MSYSLCLVTASLFAGGPGDAPTPAAPATQQVIPVISAESTPPRPTLRERIRDIFTLHPKNQAEPTQTSAGFFKQTPYGATSIQPPAATVVASGRGELDKCGHEKDYSWITGRLAHDGGHWVIRYAPPDEVDRYSGRLTLAGNLDAGKLHEGDLVCVVGQVSGAGRTLLSSAPVYQVRDINTIERAR